MASNDWFVATGKKGRKGAVAAARRADALPIRSVPSAPLELKRHKLIIGVDYGTTFSGTFSSLH
jgi:hypothetical protein